MKFALPKIPALRRAFTERRWLSSFISALMVVLALFWIMQRIISAPEGQGEGELVLEGINVVQAKAEAPPPPDEMFKPDSAPPPPPSAPPALAQPNMPTVDMPLVSVSTTNIGSVSVPVTLGSGSMSLGGSGVFGGFAGGRGTGNGGGGGGYGTGQGFKGKPLVPISTARPQMPEWACKKNIKGWVEVVFTVMPNGRVQDVKIVDADPRGVYEAAAIESVGNWIYEASKIAREVKQRVDMDPADCAYNWR